MNWITGCTGKKRYHSGESAVRHAINNQASWGIQRSYRCDHCGGWHLTSRPHPVDYEVLKKTIAFDSQQPNRRDRRGSRRSIKKYLATTE